MKQSVFNRILRCASITLALAFFTITTLAPSSTGQSRPLPDGPGKEEAQKLCSGCHELEKAFSTRQDRAGWETTISKMVSYGMKASEKDMATVLEYAVRNFPADEVPKIKVNEAKAIELESGLSLKRSQAAAIIQYREQNGPFKSIEDLKKVPGIDPAQIEAKKDRLIFK
jgi:competence protein ComEA